MIIESQLSVKWDTTKTKRYPEEIPVYLIKKNIEIVHTWRHQESERRVLSNSGLFCFFDQSLSFFSN